MTIRIGPARCFDGERFRPEPCIVTIEAGTITAIDPTPGEAPGTLLPGVIDAHVHVGFHSRRAVARGGVTTVLDLGWPLDRITQIASSPGPGAEVRYAGPILTAPGGYPIGAAWAPTGTGRALSGVAEAVTAVAELAAAGASIVKVAQEPRHGPVLDEATLHAIVEAARGHGLPVASHLGSVAELSRALDAGIDVLAHGVWSDEPLPDELVERIVAQQVAVIPTLRIAPSRARIAALAHLVEAGATILYGTDLGNPPTEPGIDVDELAFLAAAGLSAEQVLAAATSIPAARFGWRDRGRLEPGARADLVFADGDLRASLEPLRGPVRTWIAGEELT